MRLCLTKKTLNLQGREHAVDPVAVSCVHSSIQLQRGSHSQEEMAKGVFVRRKRSACPQLVFMLQRQA